VTVDPLLLVQWERAGEEAFFDGSPRSSNPNERRSQRSPRYMKGDADWTAKRDAWWRGWDQASARAGRKRDAAGTG
jgi:hypothetical protein